MARALEPMLSVVRWTPPKTAGYKQPWEEMAKSCSLLLVTSCHILPPFPTGLQWRFLLNFQSSFEMFEALETFQICAFESLLTRHFLYCLILFDVIVMCDVLQCAQVMTSQPEDVIEVDVDSASKSPAEAAHSGGASSSSNGMFACKAAGTDLDFSYFVQTMRFFSGTFLNKLR